MNLLPFLFSALGIAGLFFVTKRRIDRRNEDRIGGFSNSGDMLGGNSMDGILALCSLGLIIAGFSALVTISKPDPSNAASSLDQKNSTPTHTPALYVNEADTAYRAVNLFMDYIYNRLKDQTSNPERDVLVLEQRNWLQQRELIAKIEERIRFTQQRAYELERRCQKLERRSE